MVVVQLRNASGLLGNAQDGKATGVGSIWHTLRIGCRLPMLAAAYMAATGCAVRCQAMPGMDHMGAPASSQNVMCAPDMKGMKSMNVMGASMTAMGGHMCITPVRPLQPGDEEKARALVAKVKATIEKYKDYKAALADGFEIANPTVQQPQYHFNNAGNVLLAESAFDPTRPSSLLYRSMPMQRYKLEGVMFTASTSATLQDLDARIPLSIARWHEHINFCAAPADKTKQYLGDHPRFGMFGSLHTREDCEHAGGTFYPVIFNWMVHVFPYESSLAEVFSLNDDEPHVH